MIEFSPAAEKYLTNSTKLMLTETMIELSKEFSGVINGFKFEWHEYQGSPGIIAGLIFEFMPSGNLPRFVNFPYMLPVTETRVIVTKNGMEFRVDANPEETGKRMERSLTATRFVIKAMRTYYTREREATP